MPKRKTTTLSLAIVCFTLLAALALIRDDLCKVEYRNGAMLGFYAGTAEISVSPILTRQPAHPDQ
ncbi:MAG: Hok/Gef family protein [Saezia sp.]